MSSRLIAFIILLTVAPLSAWGFSSDGRCADLVPGTVAAAPVRDITYDDLVRLRDVGPSYATTAMSPVLSLSPDGTKLAFELRRGDLARNVICTGIFVVDVPGGQKIREIDVSDEISLYAFENQGFLAWNNGTAIPMRPKWSRDGQWVAYLKTDRGRTQVWRARADGMVVEQLTNADYDVEDFVWGGEDGEIIFSGRPVIEQARQSIDREGLEGYLFDGRFIPSKFSGPQPRGIVSRTYRVRELSGGSRDASSEEVSFAEGRSAKAPASAYLVATDRDERVAWVSKSTDVKVHGEVLRAVVRGHEYVCDTNDCRGVVGLWWAGETGVLLYLRRTGTSGQVTLFRWDPRYGHSRQLLTTDDNFLGCHAGEKRLVCVQERSAQPGRIVSISVSDGKIENLVDPNPEFGNIQLGKVERLRWKNSFGIETIGDLVLPPSHQTGQKHPLILVGYETKGFLRGGTGDEYPIFVMAAKGYAVLSFQRPPSYASVFGSGEASEARKLNQDNWVDRRNVLSSQEAGVEIAIRKGVVDADKIGITGFSDGSSSAQFALINSQLFKVASLSNCCLDVVSTATLSGPVLSQRFREMGYPALNDSSDEFWKPYSIRLNARSLRKVPILMQLSDGEFRFALEPYVALTDQGAPVAMYVFPGENHVKWQPAHRRAVYERNVDWFDFWLKGQENQNSSKYEQYILWRKMKEISSEK